MAAGRNRRTAAGTGQVAEKLATYLADPGPAGIPAGERRGVLPDTSAWIDYFRGGSGDLVRSLERALREERVLTCGQVLCELLQGVKNPAERSAVLRALGSLEYVEMAPRTWVRAGEIAAALRGRGKRIPHSDLGIAALALEQGFAVLTGDRHFRDVPGLLLEEPIPR